MPDAAIEAMSPQERIALAQRIQTEQEEASELLNNKMYKEALKKYKWVFSQQIESKAFLSASDVNKLMKGYPPAIKVIRRWRNDKEKLILAERFDLSLVSDWSRLNTCLGEENRTLEVFLKLKASGAKERLLHVILNTLWKNFARTKEYKALDTYLPHLGFHVLLHATEYDSMRLFPRHEDSKANLRWDLQRHLNYMLDEGTLSYEVALGLGRKSVAFELAKKILSVESSDRAYAGLVRSAIRARSNEEAVALFKEAKESFSARQLRKTLKEIRRLPKAHLSELGISRLRS